MASDQAKLPSISAFPRARSWGSLSFCLVHTDSVQNNQENSIKHHEFADDNQLYKETVSDQIQPTLEIMHNCIIDVKLWMTHNKLSSTTAKRSQYFWSHTGYPLIFLFLCQCGLEILKCILFLLWKNLVSHWTAASTWLSMYRTFADQHSFNSDKLVWYVIFSSLDLLKLPSVLSFCPAWTIATAYFLAVHSISLTDC